LDASTSRLVFTVTPGATYRIVLDGGARGTLVRDRTGNFLFCLDPSLVDLRAPTNAPVINAQTKTATFSGDLLARNYGLVDTAPLQVRLVARGASDLPGIHRAPLIESNLAVISIAVSLHPNEARSASFSVVCPAPVPAGTKTNYWGVFALLEESFGGSWATIDQEFLDYGYLPESGGPILSWGPGRPLPPALASSEVNSVVATDLEGPPYVTDWSTNQFFFLTWLSSAGQKSHTNGIWSATLPAGAILNSNGLLQVGPMARSTNVTIAGRFALGGRSFSYAFGDPFPVQTPGPAGLL